ncbi:DUF2064 domain-containing protein [Polaribacter tangerinus]|uniref:DUF2064 domain-containing protein n=1 Tax=Polaribacter tangerinus TaxID=1920034 RepID=UPI000B4BFCD0|nr:DUF2064 domain-containing protein [Polaribacter tangerinus]
MKNKTAILIFANSAQKEVERKSFLSYDVLAELNNQTIKTVQKAGIDYFHFSENNQVGANFAERFCNAISTVFNKGYKHIITIGNDSPQLKTKHLTASKKELEAHKNVIGPSNDGGFYLLGIHQKDFNKEEFLGFLWQTSQLQKSLISFFKKNQLSFTRLKSLNDLDSKHDLKLFLNCKKSISKKLHTLFLTLTFISKGFCTKLQHTLIHRYNSFIFNKGSPNFI